MVETIYRPISDTDEESETQATNELKVESWSDFRKELEDQAGVDRTDLTPQDAADRIRGRRVETPTPENAKDRPIVVHKPASDKPVTLREATDDLFYTRGLQQRAELLASGHTEEEVAQLGLDKMRAASRGEPLDPPPVEVKIADEPGKEGDPLSVEEASRRLANWRAEQEAQRQAELEQLVGERAAACPGVPRLVVENTVIGRAGGCKCEALKLVRKANAV
jgi:hypothetical protein